MDISDAPRYENALQQYEILLRSAKVRTAEQLAELTDSYDSMDLTGNILTELTDRLPRFQRLKTLLLSHNRIRHISTGTASSFPHLITLSLSHNLISDFEELEFLRSLPSLVHLTLEGNPVSADPDYRKKVIEIQPHIRFLDYERVTEKERRAAVGADKAPLSVEDEQRKLDLLEKLENATSIEEIDNIEMELASLGR